MNPTKSKVKYPLIKAEEVGTLVIHCSDPRFQKAFRDFLDNELGVKDYIPIIVPGGIHDLVSIARVKAARHLWDQITFMITKGKVRRVILFNHEDCKWYDKWQALTSTKIGQDITGHLLIAAEKLVEKKFGLEVECYLAKIQEGKIVFSRTDQ